MYSEHSESGFIKQFLFEVNGIQKAIPRLVAVAWCVVSGEQQLPSAESRVRFMCPSSERVSWVFQVEGSGLQLLLCPNRAFLAFGLMLAIGYLTSPFLGKRGIVTLVGSISCHWSFIFFPKCVCVRVWASLEPLPNEMHSALHFLPKGPVLVLHLRFRGPVVLAVYGLGHHLPESIISLD